MVKLNRQIIFAVALALMLCGAQEARAQRVVTGAQVNGVWRLKSSYQDNEFRILALGRNRLKVQFEGLYLYRTSEGERMANSGTGEGVAVIEGNVATFRPDGADEDCTITLKFVRGRLVVTQAGLCGFGFNVEAGGTYKKVSRKPTFN